MSQVVHSFAEATPFETRLEGLVEKLLALRAEIDSTLAELRADPAARSQPAALSDRLAELHRAAAPSEPEFLAPADATTDWIASAGQDEPAAEPAVELHPAIEAEAHDAPADAIDDDDLYAEITEPDPEIADATGRQPAIQPVEMAAEDDITVQDGAESDAPPPAEHSTQPDPAPIANMDVALEAVDAASEEPAAGSQPEPTGLMQDVQLANAAALLNEARIISLQDHRLRNTVPAASLAARRRQPRRRRYVAATLATGMAAALGFAVVMFADLDEAGARAAASDSLRTIIEHTKRHFEARPEGAGAAQPKQPDEEPSDLWIRQMEMWSMGA